MTREEPDDGLYYFAHPYSVCDTAGRVAVAGLEANFRLCALRAARLVQAGWLIFAPIVHSHPLKMALPKSIVEKDESFWYAFDNALICEAGFRGIILSPGWTRSKGCCAEDDLFRQMDGRVLFFHEPHLVSTEPCE